MFRGNQENLREKGCRDFPLTFHFGAATSAYQVEGGIENDWSVWERAGKTKTQCGGAVEHWNRYEEDFDLVVAAGLSSYRCSVEWARVEPEPGRFDDKALAQYRMMLEGLRRRKLRTMVTLHHFTHPVWFHEKSAWTAAKSVERIARFAKRVAEELKGLVDWYVTINEPMVFLLGGYADAKMPPGISDMKLFAKAAGNLMRGHVACRAVLKEISPDVPVGIAHNVLGFAPVHRWSPIDREIAKLSQVLYNHAVVRALTNGELSLEMPFLLKHNEKIEGARDSLDFLGLNYYSRVHIGAKSGPPWVRVEFRDKCNRGLTDLGWEWFHEGLEEIIDSMRSYRLPLYITENGLADSNGSRRSAFLYNHLNVVRKALNRGADIRGYFHWSLIDNFEWLEGLGPRFGLYRVDFKTYERLPTPTVEWLKEVATTGILTKPR